MFVPVFLIGGWVLYLPNHSRCWAVLCCKGGKKDAAMTENVLKWCHLSFSGRLKSANMQRNNEKKLFSGHQTSAARSSSLFEGQATLGANTCLKSGSGRSGGCSYTLNTDISTQSLRNHWLLALVLIQFCCSFNRTPHYRKSAISEKHDFSSYVYITMSEGQVEMFWESLRSYETKFNISATSLEQKWFLSDYHGFCGRTLFFKIKTFINILEHI